MFKRFGLLLLVVLSIGGSGLTSGQVSAEANRPYVFGIARFDGGEAYFQRLGSSDSVRVWVRLRDLPGAVYNWRIHEFGAACSSHDCLFASDAASDLDLRRRNVAFATTTVQFPQRGDQEVQYEIDIVDADGNEIASDTISSLPGWDSSRHWW